MKLTFKLPLLACLLVLLAPRAYAQDSGDRLSGITLEGGLTLHQYNFDTLNSQLSANGLPTFGNNMLVLHKLGLVLFLPANGEKNIYAKLNYSAGKMQGGIDSIFTASMRMSQFRVSINYPVISTEDQMLSPGIGFGSSVYKMNIEQVMYPLQSFDAAVTDLNGLRSLSSSNTFHLIPSVEYIYFLSKASPRIAIAVHAGYRISTGNAIWKSFGKTLTNSPPVDKGGVEGGISLMVF